MGALNDMRGQRGAIASLALNYGIDAFAQSIPLLSASTGISMRELGDAATFCREVIDPSQPRVANQHLVTQSILRNFSLHQNNGYRLREFDLARGLKRGTTSVKRACVVENFIKLDSQRSEDHWGGFESRFPEAIRSAEDATLFSRPDLIGVIKDILALHFARSHEIRVSVQAIRAPGISEFMKAVGLDDAWLSQAHLDRFGFEITDMSVALERVEAAIAEEFDSRTGMGIYFRLRIPDYLQRAREILAQFKIQILRPTSATDEFLIGDNPLITPDKSGTRLGILDGLPIGNAATVIMPLSPRISVALDKIESDIGINSKRVYQLNQFQIRKARESVFFRPGSNLEITMATVVEMVSNVARWTVDST